MTHKALNPVTLHVIEFDPSNGCEYALSNRAVQINPTVVLIPDFSFAQNNPNNLLQVDFTDLSLTANPMRNGPVGYHWDFGDNTPPSSLQNPSHIYPAICNFSVTLSISQNGCTESAYKCIKLCSMLPPTLSCNNTNPCAGSTITFTANPAVLGNYVFKWYKNGAFFRQTNTNTLTITAPFNTPSHSASYTVYYYDPGNNCCRSYNSLPVVVDFKQLGANILTDVKSNSRLADGSTYTFCPTSTFPNQTYVWTELIGNNYVFFANTECIQLTSTTNPQTRRFLCEVSLNGCTAISKPFTVNFNPIPVVNFVNCPKKFMYGGSVNFAFTITNQGATDPMTNEWFRNGVFVKRTTQAEKSLSSQKLSGIYSVIVTSKGQPAAAPVYCTAYYACHPVPPNPTQGQVTYFANPINQGKKYSDYTGGGLVAPVGHTYWVDMDLVIDIPETFSNCTFIMGNGTSIVLKGDNNVFSNDYATFKGCKFYACSTNVWEGIRFDNAGATNPMQLLMDEYNGELNQISEARSAIFADATTVAPANINVKFCNFHNNGNHIFIGKQSPVSVSTSFSNCTFSDVNTSISLPALPPLFQNQQSRQSMVYKSTVAFEDCEWEGYLTSQPALQFEETDGGLVGSSCQFKGPYTQAIHAEQCTGLSITGGATATNTIGKPRVLFTGVVDNPIYLKNCSLATIQWVRIGSYLGNVRDINNNGIILKNCEAAHLERLVCRNTQNGLQFYQNMANATTSTVERCEFRNNTFGLTAAPDEHPNLVPNGNPNNVNTSNNLINLQLQCNKFFVNDVGVFGSGNLPQQGHDQFGIPNLNSGNEFQTSNKFNKEWDWLWTGSNAFLYTISANGMNLSPNKGPKMMNGVSINSNSTQIQPNSNPLCNSWYVQSFQPKPLIALEPEKQFKVEAFPNPFGQSLSLKVSGVDWEHEVLSIELYDLLGKKLGAYPLTQEQTTLQGTARLANGFYLINIYRNGLKTETHKLIKNE